MHSKRIRFATEGSFPNGMASTYRILCYCKSLQRVGHKVEVVCSKNDKKIKGSNLLFSSESDGIPFTILINLGDFKWPMATYIWQELKGYILALHIILTSRKFDILFLYQGRALPTLGAIFFAKILGKKVVIELNEYPYSTFGNVLTRVSWIKGLLKWITFNCIFPLSDGVVCISGNLVDLVKKKSPSTSTLKVPILYYGRSDTTMEVKSIAELIDKGDKYMFHAGSLSEQKDGIIEVVKAYSKAALTLKDQKIRFHLVLTNTRTQKSTWRQIEEILNKSGLSDNLIVTGYISDKELRYCLKHSSVLVINKPNNLQNKNNFPTKIGDYLVSGTPLIVAAEGMELNNYLEDGRDALLAEVDDAESMARNIVDLILDEDLAKRIGDNGRKCALKNFDFAQHSNSLSTFFNSL